MLNFYLQAMMKPTKFRTVQITNHHNVNYYINQYKALGLWISIKIQSLQTPFSTALLIRYKGVLNPLSATYYKTLISAVADRNKLLEESIRICAYSECDEIICLKNPQL